MQKTVALADARLKIDHNPWYVPHYTPSIQQQSTLSKQNLIETSTEPRYKERSVFMKKVNNQNLWNLGMGSQKSMNLPLYINIGFQQRD